MHILHIITSLEVGGAQKALLQLIEYDRQHDAGVTHEVAYVHDGPYKDRFKQHGVPVHSLQQYPGGAYGPGVLWCLYQLVTQVKPTLIHTSLWYAGVLGRLIGWIAAVPVLCDLHSNAAYHGRFRNIVDRFTMGAAQYCAVSQQVANSFRRQVGAARLTTIPNGIDYEQVLSGARKHVLTRKSCGIAEDAFVIGSVGRLVSIKRYELLLECHVQLRNQQARSIRTCIVGSGPEYEQLVTQAQKLGIADEVMFYNHHDDALGMYSLFDCFVQSSQSEGISYALLEALCFGLPVVVSHDSDQHEVITNQVNGFVVPAADGAQGLVDGVRRLMTNPTLCEKIKDKNIALVQGNFARLKMVARYHALYAHVCEQKHGGC